MHEFVQRLTGVAVAWIVLSLVGGEVSSGVLSPSGLCGVRVRDSRGLVWWSGNAFPGATISLGPRVGVGGVESKGTSMKPSTSASEP